MIVLIEVILFLLIIEGIFRPRIDITNVGDVILWYGKKYRKPLKLFTLKK